MNRQEEYKEDLLRQYMNPESKESVPEGFTSNLMTRIRLEKTPSVGVESSVKRNPVPLISVAVILVLFSLALLIPRKEAEATVLPLLKLMKNIESSLPQLNLSSLFRISLPSVLMYVSIGVFSLVFLDRALYRIFHREKQS